MNAKQEDYFYNKGSCLIGLKRFELGQNVCLWIIHFYKEILEQGYYHYVPYNKWTKAYSTEREIVSENRTTDELRVKEEDYIRYLTLAQSFLERCFTAYTLQSLSEIGDEDELSTICTAIVSKFQAVD